MPPGKTRKEKKKKKIVHTVTKEAPTAAHFEMEPNVHVVKRKLHSCML